MQHFQLGRRNQVQAVHVGRKIKMQSYLYLLAPAEMIQSTLPLLILRVRGHLLSGWQITSLISNTAVQTGRTASNTQKIPTEPASI